MIIIIKILLNHLDLIHLEFIPIFTFVVLKKNNGTFQIMFIQLLINSNKKVYQLLFKLPKDFCTPSKSVSYSLFNDLSHLVFFS